MEKTYAQLSRKDLYELVWHSPLTKLSAKYGISDRGLAKICKQNNIPVPGIGYWAKVQAGHKVPRTPLPKLRMHNPEEIIFTARTPKETNHQYSDAVTAAIEYELADENRITIAAAGSTVTHPVVVKIQDSLSDRTDDVGIIKAKRGYVDCFQVTVDSRQRGLSILDALLLALTTRSVEVKLQAKHQLQVTVLDEVFTIWLDEKIDEILTEDPAPKVVHTPTGRLRIRIKSEYDTRTFYDTAKYKRLNSSLNKIIIYLFKSSDDNKRKRIAEEEQRRKDEEEHRRWKEEWRQRELRRSRVKAVKTATEKWVQVCQMKDFIESARSSIDLYDLIDEQRKMLLQALDAADDYVREKHPIQLLHEERYDLI